MGPAPARKGMMRTLARLLFWLVLAYIGIVTLSPIAIRPETPFGADAERFAAFVALSVLLVVAYPAHRMRWISLLLIAAALLEASQNLVEGRHGRVTDLEIKACGILCGSLLGFLLERLAFRSRASAT